MSTKGNGRIIKALKDKEGYLRVTFSKNAIIKKFSVHRIVLQTFKPNTEENIKAGRTQVNHIDENPSNNHLSNLEWMTSKENANHGTRNERISTKVKRNSKITGANNYKSKPKKHYETNPTRKGDFKTTCRIQGWCYDDFEEIYAGEEFDIIRTNEKNYTSRVRRYFYKIE